MKKILSLVLALVMVLSMASFAAAEEKVVVNFWHTRGSGANLEVVEHSVKQFNETIGKEKGIEVVQTFVGSYDEILTKTQLSATLEEGPQIVVSERAYVPVLVDDDLVVDMLPFAERDGLDLSNFYDVFLNTYGMVDGKLAALPYIRSTPVFYYNKGMADAKGLTAPRTIEELEAFGKAMTVVNESTGETEVYGFEMLNDFGWFCQNMLYQMNSNILEELEAFGKAMTVVNESTGETEVYGFEMLNDFGWFCQNMLYQMNSNILSEDGMSCPALEDGAMLKLLSAWRQWVDDGWCRSFASTSAESEMKEKFYQGKLAGFFASCGGLKNVEKDSAENGIELGVAPLPTWDSNRPSAPVGGGNICIVKGINTPEQIEASWEFVKFLMSDEMVTYNAMNSGYVPTTKTAGESAAMQEFWAEKPLWKVAYDQLPTAQDLPSSIYRADITNACASAASMLIQERSITAEEAVQQIADEASAIFP